MNIFVQNRETEFHFMVDIETLAVSSNAAITEIGAISISPHPTDNTRIDSFHEHCWDGYGDRDPKTIQWRLDNNLPWASSEEKTVEAVLIDFCSWIKKVAAGREIYLWCKGTDFDAVIIKNAAAMREVELPWKYNSIRDLRTILHFFPQFKVPKELVKHDGLDDARVQMEALIKCANEMSKNG